MQRLLAATKDILDQVERKTGKSVQFMRDDSLKILATLQMARNGAEFHVLRYQPSDEPIDYLVAYQAGFVLRLFENEPDQRFDFSPAPSSGAAVKDLISAVQPLSDGDRDRLPQFADFVAQWALMNLRSLPIGMRIDRWIAEQYPTLAELQRSSITFQQQQNANILSYQVGKLSVPTNLMAANAAYALFADRLLEEDTFSIPYRAAGFASQGANLLEVWDETPQDASHDCRLVDLWAKAMGMKDWYSWIPYKS